MALNTISFAVIPVVAAQDHTATFAIRAPGGEEATYSYRYKERTYSWLPFLFLNPGFVSAGLDSYERSYQEEQLELYDVIVTRFVQDATLFMQAHRMNAIKPRGEVL